MSNAPFDIIAGPAYPYIAPVGSTMPVPGAVPATPWASLGETEGGVKVAHPQTTKSLYVDQTILPKKVIRTEDGLTVTMNIANLTLENVAAVLNNVAITHTAPATGVAGYKTMPLSSSVDIPQFSMLVVGPSPYMNGLMQYELSRVLQTGKPDAQYKRDAASVFASEWMALEDLAVANTFGNLRAMTEAAL